MVVGVVVFFTQQQNAVAIQCFLQGVFVDKLSRGAVPDFSGQRVITVVFAEPRIVDAFYDTRRCVGLRNSVYRQACQQQ